MNNEICRLTNSKVLVEAFDVFDALLEVVGIIAVRWFV